MATVTKCYREALDSLLNNTYCKEKVQVWLEQLNTVYNRGFWSGYYLGQKLGEWSDQSGSHAIQKKVYVGKGKHYFPKTGIAEFSLEAYSVKKGDKILITGPTTGVQELWIEDMMVNDQKKEEATKGDSLTLKIPFRIRLSDKLYKIVEN